ncbi:hypothetical protein KM043_000155 [Ampulex compressa]|nr:hypothetical protein KM043_000155 [Ampulex compressa]
MATAPALVGTRVLLAPDGVRPRAGLILQDPGVKGTSSSEAPPDTPEVSASTSTGHADLEDTADVEILDRILCEVRRADGQRGASKNMRGKRSGRMRQRLDNIC